MSNCKNYSEKTEQTVLGWLQRGMNTLFLSLILSFVTLPWVLFRFIVDNALSVALLLLTVILVILVIILWILKIIKRN